MAYLTAVTRGESYLMSPVFRPTLDGIPKSATALANSSGAQRPSRLSFQLSSSDRVRHGERHLRRP